MNAESNRKTFKTIRLQRVDYDESGAYSLTIVTHNRQLIFGSVIESEMRLSPIGEIVREEWLRSAVMRPMIALDEFVVMPNHFHGIVFIDNCSAALCAPTKTQEEKSARSAALRTSHDRVPASISSMIAGFKAACTRRIRELTGDPQLAVWQPRFHDHIVRANPNLNALREYIRNNPLNWTKDRENPNP